MSRNFHCLRPCLRSLPSCRRPKSIGLSLAQKRYNTSSTNQTHSHENVSSISADAQQRWKELIGYKGSPYPSAPPSDRVITCPEFSRRYEKLQPGETADEDDVTLCGRISSLRILGPKLYFLDIMQGNLKIQGLCGLGRLDRPVSIDDFRELYHLLRKGDHCSLRGKPHRSMQGPLSLVLSEPPKLLSPCLHQIPTDLQNPETRSRNRHVDLLVHYDMAENLLFRSDMIHFIRRFFRKDGYVEMQTPILENEAGGARARPFETASVEFTGLKMNLRIAPELWLKRLIIGGFDRVFEIGSCFRNEGLDANHNPEFTTCEAYRAYADLESLIQMTETLISKLSHHCGSKIKSAYKHLEGTDIDFSIPFRRLDFMTGIESAIRRKLPNLASANAESELHKIFRDCRIPLPSSPNLLTLLDKLSSIYLEPQCSNPTFIVGYPECLSPLAKSFVDPKSQQRVAARAELFIGCKEIVNTYEEENSPLEQRRKFTEQLRYRGRGEISAVEESYLEALEWGLPPTGGWGCGIDRLCMLMLGAERIDKVLSFGSLRNVVGLGRKAS